MLKRVVVVLICLCLVLSCVSAAAAEKADTTVRVGFFSFDGYHHMDADGVRSGYGYDYLQILKLYTGWKYEYVGYGKSWSDMQQMLEDGRIDLVTSAQKTEERLARFAFSDYPIGTSSTIVTVRAGDERYLTSDYEELDGIRVGMLPHNSRNDSFAAFAEQNHFRYEPVYYDDAQAMMTALQTGTEIDAIVSSSLRAIQNEWIIAQFDYSPFYIMVRKNDAALLEQVNAALEHMQADYIGLEQQLFERYYAPQNGSEIAYTPEERSFIANAAKHGAVFTALINPDRAPYSSFEDGKPAGILADVAAMITARTGLSVRFVETSSRADYNARLRAGDIDLCFDMRNDFDYAESLGYKLTPAYLDAGISRLSRKNPSRSPGSIAAVRDSNITMSFTSRLYDPQSIVYYDSIDACVDAVLAGRQDAAYTYTHVAQRAIALDETNQLQSSILAGYKTSFCIGVSDNADPCLATILLKASDSLSDAALSSIEDAYVTDKAERPLSIVGFLYRYPLVIVALLLLISALIFVIVFLHMTRRRRAIEQRHASELERFLLYVCSANDEVGEFDPQARSITEYRAKDGHVLQYVRACEELSSLFDGAHEDDRARISELMRSEALQGGLHGSNEIYLEARLLQPDQSYAWMSFLFQGVAPQGHVMYYVRNIDASKREEETQRQMLQNALSAAEEASRAKSVFLSSMSHEIRTPLNAIIGYTMLTEKIAESAASFTELIVMRDKVMSYIKKSAQASQHLLELINNVLDVSAIENGRLQLACEPFRLSEFIDTLSSMFYEQCREKGVSFRIHAQAPMHDALIGDRLRLHQILANLLGNAVKFTPPGGDVVLDVQQTSRRNNTVFYRFEVRDTGAGMSPDFLPHAFEAFARQGDAPPAEGTGLGLSIARTLVEMMQGSITLTSELGHGTSFVVTLPLTASDDVPSKTLSQEPDAAAPVQRLLVAEDNAMNMEIIREILTVSGYKVDAAVNGQEALDRFLASEDGYYALILMDVQMPVMDGYTATRAIRASAHPQAQVIPIIALTANAFSSDIAASLACGMNAHVSKPIEVPVLLDAVSSLIQAQSPEN